jgi:hypothetical protein
MNLKGFSPLENVNPAEMLQNKAVAEVVVAMVAEAVVATVVVAMVVVAVVLPVNYLMPFAPVVE